jgi:selenide,water dikinase
VGPGDLQEILKGLNLGTSRRLLVGRNTLDDAAVYRLVGEEALVSTVDFFTPVVDNPRSYGRIAVSNALSDVYAMGGKPVLALNILCFSEETVPKRVIREILKGGAEKAREAGVVIGGGHSIEDKELKYGLCVTGTVRPDRVVRNSGARVGDVVILTKPLGIGLMTTGLKFGLLKKPAVRKVTRVMEELNRVPSKIMMRLGVHSCTDITGFGFLGHTSELAEASKVDIEIDFAKLPIMPEAYEMYKAEAIAGGLWTNKTFVSPKVATKNLSDTEINVLYDPQTSGGLLITLDGKKAGRMLEQLHRAGVKQARAIGKVFAKGRGRIIVRK